MIGMRGMRHHFYLELVCKIVLLYGTSKFILNLYYFEALLIVVQVNRSMRNIKQEHLFNIW